MGEVVFLVVVPLIACIGAGLVTRWLARHGRGWIACGATLGCIGGALFSYWQSLAPSTGPSDYSAVVWGGITLVVGVPAVVGAVVGLVVGALAPPVT